MKRKYFLGLAGGAAATLPAARALAQFEQQVTIAVIAPLSGPAASAGGQIVDGVRAAVNETNATTGTFGTTFAFRTFDDQDALAVIIQNVQFAASDPSIVAAIGGLDGKLTAAAMPTYANAQLPLLVSASTSDAVTARGYRNVFRLPTKDSTEGQLFARFLARRAKPKYAIVVTQDGDYGADVATGFSDQASALGIKSEQFAFSWNAPDFASAAKTLASKKPDYIFLAGETKAMGPLAAALRTAGYAGAFGASEGFFNQTTLDKYAKELEGAIVSTSLPPLERAPDVANILSDFRARAQVTGLSAFAYAAAQIVISASQRAGATNRLAMLGALQAPAAYNTIAGSFQFAFNGDPIDPNLYFYAIESGALKYLAASHPTAFIL